MADILSQDEINALIEAYKSTGGSEDSGKPVEKAVRLYDFTRPDKFCKDHLRSLNHIHAKHGALLAVSMAGLLRMDVQVNLLALDQLTYREYCASVPDGTLFAEVALEPMASIAIFEFNPALVSMCVDLVSGGASVSSTPSTRISDIDKAVMRPMVELSLKKYAEAWSTVVDLRPRILGVTTESSSRQVLLPSEGVLVCGYEVSIGDHVSMMSVCIPASAIEVVLPALALGKPMSTASQRADTINESLRRSFDDVAIECKAVLGRTALPLGDVMELEVGDIIRLPSSTEDSAELWVENVPTYAGMLGRSGRNLAVKVTRPLSVSDVKL